MLDIRARAHEHQTCTTPIKDSTAWSVKTTRQSCIPLQYLSKNHDRRQIQHTANLPATDGDEGHSFPEMLWYRLSWTTQHVNTSTQTVRGPGHYQGKRQGQSSKPSGSALEHAGREVTNDPGLNATWSCMSEQSVAEAVLK